MPMPSPSFDTWTIVFAIASSQALFTAIVLLRWKKGTKAGNYLLATLLVLFGYTLAEYVLYWTKYIYQFPILMDLGSNLTLLFGPILFFYIRHIYTGATLNKRDLWHVIPFLVGMAILSPLYTMGSEEKLKIVFQNGRFPVPQLLINLLTWGRVLHLFIYAIFLFKWVWTQPVVALTRGWSISLCLFFAGFVLTYLSYFILVRFPFFNSAWDYHIAATMTAFIYLIAYSGYTQDAIFEGYNWKESNAVVKYKNSGLTPDASNSLLTQLNNLMLTQMLYRQPELNLEILSGKLNTSKHHISQVINEKMGMNFFEYINHLRILEAKQLLETTGRQEMHIIEIAYTVGFNNKVSFNQSFRRMTGMTPTDYRRSHHKSGAPSINPASEAS
jgi:AraC-like DNA-binding protein